MTENKPTYKWTYYIESRVGRASPAVSPDGTTYVGGNDCRLRAISMRGTLLWKRVVQGMLANATVSLADDGTIYVSSETGRLYLFDNGRTRSDGVSDVHI
jgi:outer membrane protein assembly factor BamB